MGGRDTQTVTAIIQFEENKAKATTMVTLEQLGELFKPLRELFEPPKIFRVLLKKF